MDVVAVYTLRERGRVAKRYALTKGGRVLEVTGHRPWFLADRCPRGAVDCRDSDETIMVWDDSAFTYVPGPGAVRVEALQPRDVRLLAAAVEEAGGHHSFSNVRYEARLSLDVYDGSNTLLGARAPALVYSDPGDYASVLAEVYEAAMGLRVAAVDIEVASPRGGFPRPGDPVFLVSVAVAEGGEVVDGFVLEGDEVYEVDRYVASVSPHFVAGFNSAGFDARYLSAYLGRRVWDETVFHAGRPLPHIDLMVFLDAHGSALGLPFGRRYALDDAAEALGLATREELEVESSVDRAEIWRLYRENRRLVLRYAATDAVLTARLAAKVLPVLAVLGALTGIAPNVVPLLPSLGSVSEYAVYEAVRRTRRLAYEVRGRRYSVRGLPPSEAGSVVYTNRYKDYFTHPVLAANVYEYDFNMLYPSIYADRGLGPMTRPCGDGFPVPLVDDSGEVTWLRLCGSTGDPVAELLTHVYDARRATKELKKRGVEAPDQAVKILANSAYGMYSKGRGMGLHEGVAGYIFFYSNRIMDELVRYLEATGRRVVYTATDSLFVEPRPGDDPGALGGELNRVARERFGPRYSLKLEAVFESLALLAKKTYVGVTVDGGVVVKGMEKLQIPRGVKERLDEYFARVLRGEPAARVLEDMVRGLDERGLWVRTSKRLVDAAWDWDEARWKSQNNPGMRAVLATWLIQEGRLAGAELSLEELPDYTVVAYWLPMGGPRLLLDTPRGRYSCRVRARPSGDRLLVSMGCERASPTRRDLERLAVARLSVVLGYGRLIERLRAERVLDAYLAG